MRISRNTAKFRQAEGKDAVKSSVAPQDAAITDYSEAVNFIRNAIDVLGKRAADDQLARESIANLSVVLLDLSSDM